MGKYLEQYKKLFEDADNAEAILTKTQNLIEKATNELKELNAEVVKAKEKAKFIVANAEAKIKEERENFDRTVESERKRLTDWQAKNTIEQNEAKEQKQKFKNLESVISESIKKNNDAREEYIKGQKDNSDENKCLEEQAKEQNKKENEQKIENIRLQDWNKKLIERDKSTRILTEITEQSARDLNEKDKRLNAEEKELNEKEKILNNQETQQIKKASELDKRESNIRELEEKLNKRKKNLDAKEKNLDNLQKEIDFELAKLKKK